LKLPFWIGSNGRSRQDHTLVPQQPLRTKWLPVTLGMWVAYETASF
jgi:hypothetical protein